MHFKLLKKNYEETELLQFLNPTNGIMLDTSSRNTEGQIILSPTNCDLSKKEFIEYIDEYIKNFQKLKLEVIKEYDKHKQLQDIKNKSI
jgi:hypothetical protein